MDDNIIIFLEAAGSLVSVFSIYLCFVCIKARQRDAGATPLLNAVILA